MSEVNKVCPNCRSEYVSRAQTCADCQVPLLWATEEVVPGKLEDAGWDNIPQGKFFGQLVSDDDDIIEVYLGHLKSAGIRGAVLPVTTYESAGLKYGFSAVFGTIVSGGTAGQIPVGSVVEGFQYNLFVSREHYDRAEEIIQREFAALHPGQEHGYAREYELGSCPACSCGLREEDEECPDCGLSFF